MLSDGYDRDYPIRLIFMSFVRRSEREYDRISLILTVKID